MIHFIENNLTSLTSLTAFYQKFNRRVFIQESENLPLLTKLANSLHNSYPENPNVVFIKDRIKTLSEKK